MIRIENLSKSFGEHLLLDRISFSLNAKERLGVVGRNGHGKTTLLRLISGAEKADGGVIAVPKNYRIGHVRQKIEFAENTALEEGVSVLPPSEKDHHWKVEKILLGLGFTSGDLNRRPEHLSGGFQVRLNLAKALAAEPDLLLLDEPTNYLDITSIRWIERFLTSWPGELILITHDRGFMDQVVTHTLGIHRRKVRKIAGDTAKYYDQIAQDEEIHEKTRLRDERRRKEIEQFIGRFRAKARLANLVQSRIKTLQKMQKTEKLERLKTLEFSFNASPFEGKLAFTVRNLSFAYPARPSLIRGFSITVNAGERICVVGPNGKGKSTLLKLLAGELPPGGGDVAFHPEIRTGFFNQTNASRLSDSRSVEDEIWSAAPDMSRQKTRNICGAMLFSGDDALKRIGILSGGEKSRVMLGKLLASPANLLLLDEPTNHLDMESSDALLQAIDCFEGTVVMVTHNEMFLHALAERLIVFQDHRLQVFEGSYQQFLDQEGWAVENPRAETSPTPQAADAASEGRMTKKEIRRRRSAVIQQKATRLNPLKRQVEKLEQEIESGEAELNRLQGQMQQASEARAGECIARLASDLHVCQTHVDQLYDRLAALSGEFEKEKALYERELKRLS
jgi:ATP-binding cassette subfamily F protein 3